MKITLNDTALELPESTSVTQLLQHLGIDPRQTAVEINQQLVPREEHADHILREGDSLEVVTLVGGG